MQWGKLLATSYQTGRVGKRSGCCQLLSCQKRKKQHVSFTAAPFKSPAFSGLLLYLCCSIHRILQSQVLEAVEKQMHSCVPLQEQWKSGFTAELNETVRTVVPHFWQKMGQPTFLIMMEFIHFSSSLFAMHR